MTRIKRIMERLGASGIVFMILLLSILMTKWVVDLVSYKLLWTAIKWTAVAIMASIVFGSFNYSKDCFMQYLRAYKKRKEYFDNVRRR